MHLLQPRQLGGGFPGRGFALAHVGLGLGDLGARSGQRGPGSSGRRLSSAASSTLTAISASTQRVGGGSTPTVTSPSVSECASVKVLTSTRASRQAADAVSRGVQPSPSRRQTATSSSVTRNRM